MGPLICKVSELEILYKIIESRREADLQILAISGNLFSLGNESVCDNKICLHISKVEIENKKFNLSTNDKEKLLKKLFSNGIKNVSIQ